MKIGKYRVHYNHKSFMIAFLVVMNTQIFLLEGAGVSWLKVLFLCLGCLFSLMYFSKNAKVVICGAAFYLTAVFCATTMSNHLRTSTVYYMGMFVFGFSGYCCLLKKNKIPIEQFVDFLKYFIYAYTVVLLIQHLASAVGIWTDLLNMGVRFENKFKINSLAIEPSHAGRIVGCLGLAYLKLAQQCYNYNGIKSFFRENKKVCLAFLYFMLFCGSSTALMALALVLCFFVQKKYLKFSIPIIIALYLIIPILQIDALTRVKDTIDAVLTGDQSEVVNTDSSAAARTGYYFSFMENFNPGESSYWLGHGIEEGTVFEIHSEMSEENQIGGIYQYGFLTFVIALLFVYICMFRFLSIENAIFILLLNFSLCSNVAYVWGCLMILTSIGFYKNIKKA